MIKGTRAAEGPFAEEVTAGTNYFWCACGLSNKQPFCDGSHKGTDFTPVKYTQKKMKQFIFVDVNSQIRAPCVMVVIVKGRSYYLKPFDDFNSKRLIYY